LNRPSKSDSSFLRTLGICIGASTISIAAIERKVAAGGGGSVQTRVIDHGSYAHGGNPKKVLRSVILQVEADRYDRIAATGRKFRHFVNLSSVSEPEAVEHAYRFSQTPGVSCPAVVSAGGETFMVYVLDGSAQIANVITGNKCASGTGEFFLQQLRRMNVSLEEAARWTSTEDPYHVSGRCSVFCKSDCTHATNKGIPRAKVTAGLCKMMADKILELLKKVERRNIMIVGGTTRNIMMIDFLKKQLPDLIIPPAASYFEALGAALWALDHKTKPMPPSSALFAADRAGIETLPPIKDAAELVEFKSIDDVDMRPHDPAIIGLDVGSTTTKAVLLRTTDDAILASVYLRTNGDPVGASRLCYRSLHDRVSARMDPDRIRILGLGVTGSGRQIAGLHALTDAVINEIIAHATAAVHFDPGVDTIFEIGGQDAKYTYIVNGVPSDYAMNEACSAGTGSFLEESAYETLGVKMEEIAAIALQGRKPPNFNDQCAAFIASDIKNAIHEGVVHEDIVAGLVYSICMNYTNRVKGNRPVGTKIFMQGGVCYNQAVPLAMATLVGKPIVVPPEPGLMGAFGVALEVKHRQSAGLLEQKRFDLRELAEREVSYGKNFVCKGGPEGCDRRCEITVIEIDGEKYPFGGACNRYYNLRKNVRYDIRSLDQVRQRQKHIFHTYAPDLSSVRPIRGKIGFNRSFLINTYYPLFANFFANLGFEPVIVERCSRAGIDQRNAAFCYPAELAHGFFHALLQEAGGLDYIFLPHFRAIPNLETGNTSQLCPLAQGETYYLRATFRDRIQELQQQGTRLLTPVIDLTEGLEAAGEPLMESAGSVMGVGRREVRRAFEQAVARQRRCLEELQTMGTDLLAELKTHPNRMAVVLFGRPYNAFVDEAHMGIPHKLASRGVPVLPLDCLPLDREVSKEHMYWGMGQRMLRAAALVKHHPQLFGVFITNFSCGPDSFILGYFREIMGRKPSLTLELDSHTADAGLETRIEAFLDVVSAYRQLETEKKFTPRETAFKPAEVSLENGRPLVIDSDGNSVDMRDDRVKLLFPSMGRIATEFIEAVFQGKGFNAMACPPAGEGELKTGRANTSCKECLPLILTTGTLLNQVQCRRKDDEILVYFMAGGSGPCRFGQYSVFMRDLIRRRQLRNVTLLSLTSENAYAGLDSDFQRRGWWAIVASDVMEDTRSMLLANAVDVHSAMQVFEEELLGIKDHLRRSDFAALDRGLRRTAAALRQIPLKRPVTEVPTILLAGEIFVRRDGLSRQYITEKLAEQGFATVCSPVAEWMLYADYLVRTGRADCSPTILDRLKFTLRNRFKQKYEHRIKTALATSGLVHSEPIDMDAIIQCAAPHFSPELGGEAVLTIGSAMADIVNVACGVIAIGPFGCMPNRIAEAILSETMNRRDKLVIDPDNEQLRMLMTDVDALPFLAIESDGSPFPQVITAKLEAFCLRARRLHERLYTMN